MDLKYYKISVESSPTFLLCFFTTVIFMKCWLQKITFSVTSVRVLILQYICQQKLCTPYKSLALSTTYNVMILCNQNLRIKLWTNSIERRITTNAQFCNQPCNAVAKRKLTPEMHFSFKAKCNQIQTTLELSQCSQVPFLF